MARDTLAVQEVGADLTLDAVVFVPMVAADDIEVTGVTRDTILIVTNAGSSGAGVATVVAVDDIYGRSEDLTITVAQGATGVYGKFLPDNWNQAGTFTIHIDSAFEDVFSFAAVSFGFTN